MVEDQVMEDIGYFKNSLALICVLLVISFTTLIVGLAWRPFLPQTAPMLAREGYPFLGMLRFFSDRRNFYLDCVAASRSGHFSFYFGKHLIIGVSGLEGRKIFYESKDLDMSEGYALFFATNPSVKCANEPGEASASFIKWSSKTIITMMRNENLVKKLPLLVSDAQSRLESLAVGVVGTFDPFESIYRIIYHLTMRAFGANDIAESPELLERTLALFEQIEAANSPTRIIFPWLPTMAHLKRTAAGTRLSMIFNKIVQERKTNGTRGDDALQYLLDNDDDIVKIISFVLNTLSAGQFNSGINAAWMFVYLACNAEWYDIVQCEVDSAVALHRVSPAQTPVEILATLTIEDWEAKFPMLDLCLRECIRLQLVGTGFRKNISGRDLPIGKAGEVIPADASVIYLIDEIHMDPKIYTDPHRWDPGRYLPGRAEDKKKPLSWLGWGLGRNPCLGMRFAKLEMGITGAFFTAMFNYELLDIYGNSIDTAPNTNRNNHAASKPDAPVRLRYTVR